MGWGAGKPNGVFVAKKRTFVHDVSAQCVTLPDDNEALQGIGKVEDIREVKEGGWLWR